MSLPDNISRQYSKKGREEYDRIFKPPTNPARGPMLGGEKVVRKNPKEILQDAPSTSTNKEEVRVYCRNCFGSGTHKLYDHTCNWCMGKGYMSIADTQRLQLPAPYVDEMIADYKKKAQ